MAFVNSHVLRWKNFYFLYLTLLLPIYTEHRNDSSKLCLTPVELLQLAEWMHSSYCDDTGVLLKRLVWWNVFYLKCWIVCTTYIYITPLTMFLQMCLLANRTIEKIKFSRIPFLVAGTISICFCWPNWYFFLFMVHMKLCFLVCSSTGFSVTSKLCGLLTKIPKTNSVDSNSDSLENTSRAYSRNLGHGCNFSE